ncbi:MAG TPA: polysaccharide biosynthesis/export family protein [Cellvibrio sp.]|nr:polysaccharide biosynthesis/export family protein [Cellvibrio sp.]
MILRFRTWVWAGLALVVFSSLVQAQTANSGSSPANYTIGAGDEIRITIYGQPELTAEGQVSSAGTIVVPLIGNLAIAGKTSADAAYLIADRYQQGNYLKNAQVNVLITKYRSQVVAILGKVNNPGKLVLEGPTSLTQALASAGGIAASGSERLILTRISKNGRPERIEYDLQKLLNYDADEAAPVWLKDGDTLYVPNAGRFYINGEVHSPGMYPLDRPLNVMQALSAGGGPTNRASENSVKLFRQQADGSVKELRAKPDDRVLDGDVLVVKESLF